MSPHDNSPIEATFTKGAAEDAVIPLLEEQLVVATRVIETGTVRLHKHTEERTEIVEVPLTSVQWQVEHVPMNLVVGEQPAIRLEGDTTVYPVMEERLTILRELVLLEEVRVTRRSVTTTDTSSHILKREQIAEERIAAIPEAGQEHGRGK